MQAITVGHRREPSGSRYKMQLIRKIAWRMQALVEGDLSERARRRAEDLANDDDTEDIQTQGPLCDPHAKAHRRRPGPGI